MTTENLSPQKDTALRYFKNASATYQMLTELGVPFVVVNDFGAATRLSTTDIVAACDWALSYGLTPVLFPKYRELRLGAAITGTDAEQALAEIAEDFKKGWNDEPEMMEQDDPSDAS